MVIKSFPIHARREELSSHNRFLIEFVGAISGDHPCPLPPTLALVSLIKSNFADGCSLISHSDEKGASWEGLDDAVACWLRTEIEVSQREGRRQEIFHGFDRDRKVDYLAVRMSQDTTLLVWRREKLFYPDDWTTLQIAVLLYQGHCLSVFQDRGYLKHLEREWASKVNNLGAEITLSTFNNSRELIILFKPDGQVTWYNKTAVEMFSHLDPFPLQNDQNSFHWLSRITHPEDLKTTMHTFRDAIKTGLDQVFSTRFMIDDKHSHLLRCELVPSEQGSTHLRQWVLSGIDLTKLEIYCQHQREDMSIVVTSMSSSVRNLKAIDKNPAYEEKINYELEIIRQNLYSLGKYFEAASTGPEPEPWDNPKTSIDLEKCIDACLERHAQKLKGKNSEVVVEWLNSKHIIVTLNDALFNRLLDIIMQCFLEDPRTNDTIMTIKYEREDDALIIQGPTEQEPLDLLTIAMVQRFAQLLEMRHEVIQDLKRVELWLARNGLEYQDPISGGGNARCQLLQSLETFLRFLPSSSPLKLTCCSNKSLIRHHLRQLLQDQPRLKMQIVEYPSQVQWDYSAYNIIVFDFLHQPESFAKELLGDIMEKINRDRTYCVALGCPKDSLESSRVAYSCVSQPLLDREIISAILDTIIRFALTTSACAASAQTCAESKQMAIRYGSSKLAGECPLQIMVVEDSLLNQKVLVKTLAKLGYDKVLTAQDGQQGVETYRCYVDSPKPIEMLFMDVQMPVLDGYGASLAIRNIQGENRSGPHIVAISANDFVEDRKTCLRSGMCRFAGKPLDWNQLEMLLKEGYEAVHGRQPCRCRSQPKLQW